MPHAATTALQPLLTAHPVLTILSSRQLRVFAHLLVVLVNTRTHGIIVVILVMPPAQLALAQQISPARHAQDYNISSPMRLVDTAL